MGRCRDEWILLLSRPLPMYPSRDGNQEPPMLVDVLLGVDGCGQCAGSFPVRLSNDRSRIATVELVLGSDLGGLGHVVEWVEIKSRTRVADVHDGGWRPRGGRWRKV